MARRPDLSGSGYSYDETTRVLRVHHSNSRDIDIQGKSEVEPPAIVAFDDPHLPASSLLNGPYPNSYFNWSPGLWRIVPPSGRFGTFHIAL
jgi:hypothetical protein